MTRPGFIYRQPISSRGPLMFCLGTSMYPTLTAGDILHVRPYGERSVRPGDVVVFMAPDSGLPIVHRVLRMDRAGMVTGGDNNIGPDGGIVGSGNIVGRVVAAERDGRKRPIAGGLSGLVLMMVSRLRASARARIAELMQVLPGRAFARELLRRVVSLRGPLMVVRFGTDGNGELHLLQGRRVVGRDCGTGSGWRIRFPYRVFLDERVQSLPGPAGREPARRDGTDIALKE